MNITNDKVTNYINSFYKPLDDDLGLLREESEEKNIPLILKETENYLCTMLSILKPKRILEIGTAYGYSALFFTRFLPDCKVTTLERSQYMCMNAERNFEDRPEGFRIDLRVGDAEASLDALSEQLSQDQYYDFVFIDAGKSHYKEFFDKASKLCKPGTTIICDNILMKAYIVDKAYEPGRRHRTSVKRMQEFLNYINEREDLTVSLLSCGDGLAVIKLND